VPVGDDRIMNDQLLHLVFASARPQIGIRFVPFAAGPQVSGQPGQVRGSRAG
jgi:hypothetical protein